MPQKCEHIPKGKHMQPVEILINFNDWDKTVYANVPSSLYQLEYLTREAFGGEPNIAYSHYVAADDDYAAHAVIRIPNNLSIFADTQEELILNYAEDTWGSTVIYRWVEYEQDWRLI